MGSGTGEVGLIRWAWVPGMDTGAGAETTLLMSASRVMKPLANMLMYMCVSNAAGGRG